MKTLQYITFCALFLLFAIGSGSEGSGSEGSGSEGSGSEGSGDAESSSYMDSADVTQKDFLNLIAIYDSIFDTRIEGNSIQFQEMCNDKNNLVKAFFKRDDIKNFTVQNWFGEVTEIQSFYNGGGLKVRCNSTGSSYGGTTFYLNTSNIIDDLLVLEETRIKKDSELYKTCAKLKEGSIIRFSGKFIRPYFAPSNIGSNSEYANIDQDYIFKFTSVEDISTDL
jgi:hypothetical protein